MVCRKHRHPRRRAKNSVTRKQLASTLSHWPAWPRMAPQYENVGTAAMAAETWLRDVHSVQTVTVQIQSLHLQMPWSLGRQRKAEEGNQCETNPLLDCARSASFRPWQHSGHV